MKRKPQKIPVERREKWDYDHFLIQLSLQGNQGAWETLYREAQDAVWNTVRKNNWENVLSTSDMEEIVQDAFARSYARRAEFEGRSQFKTWVCGFAVKIALEYKRKKYSRLRKQRVYSYASEPSFPDPELSCILKESDFCLWLAFDSLSKRHRLLLSCYVLKWENVRAVQRCLKISYRKMREELETAKKILRSRYLYLYCKKREAHENDETEDENR